jgi:MGT family glycosyltransferase
MYPIANLSPAGGIVELTAMRLGIISPPVSGHINPFAALGRELQRRGHRVIWFHMKDLAERIGSEDLEFCPIGEKDHPQGSLAESLAQLGRLQGWPALRFTIKAIRQTTDMICRDLPDAVRRAGVDALLVDQTEPAGGSVAEHLGMPFITVCNALALNRDPYVPPPFTGWGYRKNVWARLRNAAGYAISHRLMSPVTAVLESYRKVWKLPALQFGEDAWSRLAQISQQPAEFDFPRQRLPENFHYTGPLRDPHPRRSEFPWERLDGRPVIFASLGTLQNGKEAIFRCFSEACEGLDVQLVVAHGGGLDHQAVSSLAGDPIVVAYAPQVEILKRCALTLTHAGLNTILDSLSQGVPAIAVPLTFEQPAIAARLVWAGAGCRIPPAKLKSKSLKKLIAEVLERGSYRQAAGRMANSIRQAGGLSRAADIIEQSLSTDWSDAPKPRS